MLSFDEVNAIIGSVDLSNRFGHRNKAMLETLYSCGLRVSELVTLRISDLFFKDGFIRVIGKGDKQPVGAGQFHGGPVDRILSRSAGFAAGG